MSLLGIGTLLATAVVVSAAILILLEWPTGSVLTLPSPWRV
jgi:hypothetical protein